MRQLDMRSQELRARQAQFCRVTFLKKNEDGHHVHCLEADDWEICRVGPVSSYSRYGEQVFDSTRTYQRDALLSLLEQAFNLGRASKARDVRAVLEINS